MGAAAVAVAAQPAPQPRPAPEGRPGHLRVVEPAERARRSVRPAHAGLLSAAIFGLVLAVVVAHTLLVQGQVKLDHLDAQLTTEQLHYQQLRRDVAQLESPTRIVEAATPVVAAPVEVAPVVEVTPVVAAPVEVAPVVEAAPVEAPGTEEATS